MFEPISYSLLEMRGGEVVNQFPDVEIKVRESHHSGGPESGISLNGYSRTIKVQQCIFCGDYKYNEYQVSRKRFLNPIYKDEKGNGERLIAGKCKQYFIVKKGVDSNE